MSLEKNVYNISEFEDIDTNESGGEKNKKRSKSINRSANKPLPARHRFKNVRLSMKRIKTVLTERVMNMRTKQAGLNGDEDYAKGRGHNKGIDDETRKKLLRLINQM